MTDRFREVTKDELLAWVKAYPRPLEKDLDGTCDPHRLTFNDFAVAPKWPESVVAYFYIDWGLGYPEHGYRVLREMPDVVAPQPKPAQPAFDDNGYGPWCQDFSAPALNVYMNGVVLPSAAPDVVAGRYCGFAVSDLDLEKWMHSVAPTGYRYDRGYLVGKKPDWRDA